MNPEPEFLNMEDILQIHNGPLLEVMKQEVWEIIFSGILLKEVRKITGCVEKVSQPRDNSY